MDNRKKHLFYGERVAPDLGAPTLGIVSWELSDGVLSMQGECRARGLASYGQCQEELEKSVDRVNPLSERVLLARMLEVWKRWHLNDMRAGCEHQREEKWNERPIYEDKPTSAYVEHPDGHKGWNMWAWVPFTSHEKGLLMKPCPVCGYEYGSKWLREEIPIEIQEEIRSWPEND